MLPRHRRRVYLNAPEYRGRRPVVIRAIIAAVLLVVLWYLITTVIGFFDGSIGTRASVALATSSDSVEVALQGEDWQRADQSIRLYAGDAVASRGSSDAVLTFFDGSKVRMDQSTEVEIEQSDNRTENESRMRMQLRRGQLWVLTPSVVAFSGSIARTIVTEYATIALPANASARISPELIHVVSADGQGLLVTLSVDGAKGTEIYVGEGQYLSLSAEDRAALEDGADPYSLRDPSTVEMIRDPFLVSSLSILQRVTLATEPPTEGEEGAVLEDLIVTSPANNAEVSTRILKVEGRVSERVASILVQGQDVSIASNGTFSAELNVSDEERLVVRIEAQDVQGIPISTIERTITNTYSPFVEPVRIVAPVGSGGTFVTGLTEIEIAGEAPAETQGVMVNDYVLQLFRPGARTWSYLASTALGNMKTGENVYTVYALDIDGNRSPASRITIRLEPGTGTGNALSFDPPPLKQNAPLRPGSLAVTAPASGTEATVTETETLIEGTTIAETYSISVNGYTLQLYEPGKTTWNYIASVELTTMKRGRNVYRVVSRNASGEILDIVEYVITYSP